jgi:pimeloyl-ACP methyl ester carboxylesterase
MIKTGLLIAATTTVAAARPALARSNTMQSIGLTVGNLQFDALSTGPADGELVLCLHGFPEFKEAWIPILEKLGAAGYRAVAVDQRGYSPGARPTNVSDYTPDILAADVMGFAQALGASRFRVVGHDRGGSVAWVVAKNYPNALLSLTVLCTPHRDAFAYALVNDPLQQGMSGYIQTFDQPPPAGENFLLANNAANLTGSYNGFVSAADVNLYVQRLEQPGALTAALNHYRAENVNIPLGKVTVPTFFIWGANDLYLGRIAATVTADFCDGPYTFVQLPGRSHWLMDEDPAAIFALLQQQFTSTVN